MCHGLSYNCILGWTHHCSPLLITILITAQTSPPCEGIFLVERSCSYQWPTCGKWTTW